MNPKSPILLLALLFPSCTAPSPSKPPFPEILQTCQMCGAEWLITPYNSNTVISPTIEWCYFDGNYCETGFDIIKEAIKNNEELDDNCAWINHCLQCPGCRMVHFNPTEWSQIITTIKTIRHSN
jgi:hypothetical protein